MQQSQREARSNEHPAVQHAVVNALVEGHVRSLATRQLAADMLTFQMKTWRIQPQDVSKGLSKWSAGLSEAFVRLEPKETQAVSFGGEIAKVRAPMIEVSRVRSSGHEVRRLPEHIRESSRDICFVNLQRHGRSLVTQYGIESRVAPMDLSIVDTRNAFSIRHDSDFDLASIAIPAGWIEDNIADKHISLSRTAVGRELSSMIWRTVTTMLAASDLGVEFESILATHLQENIALATRLRPCDERLPTHVTLEMLQSYLMRNIDRNDIGAKCLAQHFGLSARRVHQIFAPSEFTISEFISEKRLQKAAEMLLQSNRDGTGKRIADIAWLSGFPDPSYFNRRFKRHFGCTPTEYRLRAHSAAR